jgi:aconitate hydratase
LKLAGILTVKGGTGNIIEYFGPGVETLSCTGMATICNMGAEMGCTTSVFPFTEKTYDFLVATRRKHVGDFARIYADGLRADEGAEAYFDRIIHLDLSELEPHINGPFSPDLATPVGKFKEEVRKHGWPENISVGLVCILKNNHHLYGNEDLTANRVCLRSDHAQMLPTKTWTEQLV